MRVSCTNAALRWGRRALLFGLLLVAFVPEAPAHQLGLTDTSIEVAASGVRILSTFPIDELAELTGAVKRTETATESSPAVWWPLVEDAWRVSFGSGSACPLQAGSVTAIPDARALQFEWRAACDTRASPLQIKYQLATAFRPGHRNVTHIYFGARPVLTQMHRDRTSFVLPVPEILARTGGTLPADFIDGDPNRSLGQAPEVAIDGLMAAMKAALVPGKTAPLANAESAGAGGLSTGSWGTGWSVAGTFVPLGIRHILFGADHVAFVIGMAALSGRLRRLVVWVSLFTLAHSVTLSLAATGMMRIPPMVTEPLIAISVMLLGVQALFAPSAENRRLPEAVMVFGFGLVHGVGLSYQLASMLAAGDGVQILGPLLWFNIGVELGQLMVILAALAPLAWLWRDSKRHDALTFGAGLGLTGAGAYWLFARVLAPWG